MELISQAHIDSPFHFEFFAPQKLPHPLMALDNIDAGYGDRRILQDVRLSLLPGDRIGLLGHNGAGKSTLIKLLAGKLAPLSGDLEMSSELNIGYFAQHQLDQLDPQASAYLHLLRLDKGLTEQAARNYLGGFDFHGDRVMEPVAPFSGGEKARLVLALLIYQRPNLLLLDEPTNHLDLDMRHALTLALQDYAGAMVLVSHDRHLLRAVTDRFLLVDEGRVEVFDDDLDAYRRWLMQPREASAEETPEVSGPSRKAQRQQEAEKRRQLQPLKNQLKQLEQRMDQLNGEKHQLEAELAQPAMYEPENLSRLQQLHQRQAQLGQQLDQAEESWLQLSEQLQDL